VSTEALWSDITRDVLPILTSFRQDLRQLDVDTKSDRTLLTNADVAVQQAIISRIQQHDPSAAIVAEEAQASPAPRDGRPRIYVIDPIDGTAEFVKPDGREFCTVVCLLVDRVPESALVIVPELGDRHSPIIVSALAGSAGLLVNGQPAPPVSRLSHHASTTRSAGSEPSAIEQSLAAAGYQLKTRTTSQTLDMTRVAVDLQPFSELPLPTFDLFVRDEQKVWDGAAGMCLALASGRTVADGDGVPRRTVDLDLSDDEPRFARTIAGAPDVVARFGTVAS
jgi:3'(2'), 5'-bisphosphate nucleotidase